MRPSVLTLALAVVVAASACGGPQDSPAPTTPTPPAGPTIAALTVVVSPTPLVAVPQPDPTGDATRYAVSAALTFQETAGRAARVTALDVSISSPAPALPPAAWSVSAQIAVDIAVAARGTATFTVPIAFEAAEPDAAARWRLVVTASDQNGQALTIAPIDVPLTVPAIPDAVLVGAGDMDGCDRMEPEFTARLLDRTAGTVFTAGDNVYPSGTLSAYTNCYGPRWGRHLDRTLATAGNHDYYADGGTAYFAYFGAAAGTPGLGYDTRRLGTWQVITLNSNIAMTAGSAQYAWLQATLAASQASCTVAIWHHPLFSSGQNGNSPFVRDVWRLLVQHGVDVVVNGHDHTYERFAPQDADGRATTRGPRAFVVGTGGYPLYDRGRTQANSEVFENRTFGVLTLTLKRRAYEWAFVPIDGQSFRDAGTGTCVTTPAVR